MMYNFTIHAEDAMWTVDIDRTRGFGVFDRIRDGLCGSLWFKLDRDADTPVLVDFGGVPAVPRAVVRLLLQLGYGVPSSVLQTS